MSPIIHTALPPQKHGHFGEFEAGQLLNEIDSDDLELWFNLDSLPGVPEIDLILYQPLSGLYLIEIKSFKIDEISEVKNGELILKNSNSKNSNINESVNPISQIRRAQIALMNYLKNFELKKSNKSFPFIQTTILFPRILKESWLQKFNSRENIELSKKIMFMDDINSVTSLNWKLEDLRNYPLLGVHPDFKRDHGPLKIEFVRSAIKSRIFTQIEESKKIEILKSNVDFSDKYAKKYPFSERNKIQIFKGAPGTGKTTILRQIALDHSKEGAAVLYLCFQKVLAAEQRRELEILRQKNNKKGFIESYDLWEFFSKFNNRINIELAWDEIVDLLLESENFRNLEYDTILIDESQDLPYAAFEMLKHIKKSDASIFISFGNGQELFKRKGEKIPAPWLSSFLEKEENVTFLRRSFRNSALPFRLAQSFWENALDVEKNNLWIDKKFDLNPNPENTLPIEFDVVNKFQDFIIEYCPNKEFQKEILYQLISKEIKYLENINKPNDLLIIVGNQTSKNSIEDVIAVLNKLEIAHTNLTLVENRRIPTDLVKIITQINSRGLTAEVVIVLDFHEIINWTKLKKIQDSEFDVSINNLGYICLSRAKSKTILLVNTEFQNEATNFVMKSYYKLSSGMI